MTLCRSSLKSLIWSGVFTMVLWIILFRSLVVSVSAVAFVFLVTIISSAATNDEKTGWSAYRMTLPVSRRDVVLGRYAALLLMSLLLALVPSALAALIAVVSSTIPLPGPLADVLSLDKNPLIALFAVGGVCFAFGTVTISVSLPAFFKFGLSKAAMLLPVAMILVLATPFLIVSVAGGEAMDALSGALAFVMTPDGAKLAIAGAAAFVIILLAMSALVSIRVYERREL
ncbi:ABC-2 transporter permease [Coriobacterium glomerans]|nr:ABC-2 transporter permease [Coriobacterium glomerans]